jgi:transposase
MEWLMGTRIKYPDWVEAQRRPGTNISLIDGKYYLYGCHSEWNKQKGRADKKNDGYLGRITEDGFIPKGTRESRGEKVVPAITVKEYGASYASVLLGTDMLENLCEKFGKDGEKVFVIAVSRLVEQCPFKRTEKFYQNSYISETLPDLMLSGKEISGFLRDFGGRREEMVGFMKQFIGDDAHIIFDGSAIVSQSEKMNINREGYNAHREYDPQINLIYAFSCDANQPAYYRIVPGNVRDVSAIQLSLKETGLTNAVIVADKGFGSEDNFKAMDEAHLNYVVPLKRNNAAIDYKPASTGSKADFDGHFMFANRPIWYFIKNDVYLFLDPDLKSDEEKNYLRSVEKKTAEFDMAQFMERQNAFGTIAIKANGGKSAQEVFEYYKQRREIEQSFDFLKNLLDQDKTYMQSQKSLETWAFVNHIALVLCYKIYSILKSAKLLNQYSVADFLQHLKYIYKVKVNDEWNTSTIGKKTAALLAKLNLDIT